MPRRNVASPSTATTGTSKRAAGRSHALSRRRFLKRAGTAVMAGGAFALPGMLTSRRLLGNQDGTRPKVAAVFTDFRHRLHAHVILENFLQPYLFNGESTDPGVDVVSFYADQFHPGDMARDVANDFHIPLYRTISEALCLGGKKLAVDAVLLIGEHGEYPKTSMGQVKYPRKRFFDEIVAVMKDSNRFVPVFNDKHLSYRYDWAKEMYDTAQKLHIPLMAGSSVPLAQRRPPLDLPPRFKVEEAVSIHGGPVESYDFHALEVLQSIIEFRKGGETGISTVEFLEGSALRNAMAEGRFSRELAEAAMAAEFGETRPLLDPIPGQPAQPHAILLTYKDGVKGTILRVGSQSTRWNFACRLQGESRLYATSYYVGPWENRNLFKALSHAIQTHFRSGVAPYPVERTLLTTGVVEALMHSRHQGKPIGTPHLEFSYNSRDFSAMRELGASWEIITEETPENKGIVPVGLEG